MKHTKRKTLLSCLLAAAVAGAAGLAPSAHAQFDLVILNSGNDGAYSAMEGFYTNAGYTVSYENFSNVTPTQADLDNLEANYDVAIVSRTEVSSTYESQEWNNLGIGLVLINPFLPRETQWDWLPESGSSAGAASHQSFLDVVDATHPILNGVGITDNQIHVFDPEGVDGNRVRARADGSQYSTDHHADTILSYEPNGTRTQLFAWEAGEFYPDSEQTAAFRRVLFGMEDTNDDFIPSLTADGAQLMLNMTEWAAVPEPGTVATWIGLGAFGSVLLIRPFRRKKAD